MSRYTIELRQEIVAEFCRRHNGQFDAALFFKEVEEQGVEHAAYDWFQWNKNDAAYQFNLQQARAFAHGLKVSFVIETVGGGSFTMDAPMVVSPLAGRQHGGGYFLTDPENEEHVAELCFQAANALQSWVARYQICFRRAGLSADVFEEAVEKLDGVKSPKAAA